MPTLPSTPKVGVVLVNYNGARFMPECVASLEKGDYPAIEIVVVDNLSTDGSREWLQEQRNLNVVLLGSNTGITGGNNAGIKRSLELGCDHVFILNNDTVLESDTISKLVESAEPNAILVPRIYFFDQPTILNTNFGGFSFLTGRSRQMFYGRTDSETSRERQYGTMASTCALMVPAGLFEKVGLMDENYFIYFDDTDFVARAVQEGYRVKYVPDSILFHKESLSSGGDKLGPLPLYYMTRNRLYFMRKHQRNLLLLALFFAYFSATQGIKALMFVVKRDADSLKALLTAIKDYLSGRLGYREPSAYRLSAAGKS